ncbi:MAG: ABC-F family ATP-binding cassette domain-containing protein [Actinomycetota bacterium]|nr:ABC-F family ATP-binding cassette domain-containing protein [Actinomycetota bacterium]MDA2970791.1 ABC-F family ATP-binding cassette domain-containing protein [Actinomycetota bacterium]MDA3001138.1 ABC-F family ATP-binding cassette domain-containing protein [Actinomycetota bacterium]
MLQVQALTVEVGGRVVVDQATFTVMAKDKVGLVGRNGAGKTSLFKVLGGDVEPTLGKVVRKGGFGYLPQDPRIAGVFDGRTAISHILSGRQIDDDLARLEKLRVAMEEEASDRNVSRYSRAEEEFALKGGYAAESEARSIAAGLGLHAERLSLPVGVLSGGERRRVELSRILFAGSDALLLDEPTNHLDIDAKTWLLQFLRQYRGALLVISHDLDLLDEAITRVLHLDRPAEDATGHVVEYRGTYSQYRKARAEDEIRLAKKAAQQAKEIARLQTVVDRFGAKATKAAMAHSIEKRIDRLEGERVVAPTSQKSIRVRFPDPPPCGETVLVGEHLCKGYGGPLVFEDVSFDLGRGERLLVLGLNGAGKTSLLRILAGETTADLGDFHFGHQVHAGYYAQEHDNLDTSASLLDNIRREVPPGVQLTETELRGLLGMFGLSGEKVFQRSGTLSGGEKTKLALAMMMVGRNNLLLLDEPTNNLDPPSRDAVAEALSGWKGAIVFVSHDVDFVEKLEPTKVLLMPDGEVDYFSSSWLDLVSLS